jgi:hypothetical protein
VQDRHPGAGPVRLVTAFGVQRHRPHTTTINAPGRRVHPSRSGPS